MSDKCPDCNAELHPDRPDRYRCGSGLDGKRSTMCLQREGPPRDPIGKLQTRVDELEAIIRACFLVWHVGGTAREVVIGNAQNGTAEHKQAIIDICKPDAPTAPGAAPCDRPTNLPAST